MKQRGFTLIEVMIVLVIIGILVVIAMPAYQNYIIRARVTEGLNLATAAQLAVSETALSTSVLPATQAATTYTSPAQTPNVASIVIANDGTADIIITYTAAIGGTIILVPTLIPHVDITWDCTGGTLSSQFRPANCRP